MEPIVVDDNLAIHTHTATIIAIGRELVHPRLLNAEQACPPYSKLISVSACQVQTLPGIPCFGIVYYEVNTREVRITIGKVWNVAALWSVKKFRSQAS